MTTPVRTRYAPSPTGDPHLGNARTAILNWLFARNQGGVFVLRVEDTDIARNVERGEEANLEALDWLGLDRDEGPVAGGPFGPYRQSERVESHRSRARQLVADGHAYRCFCSEETMAADRAAAIATGRPPGMDMRCRDLDPSIAEEREAEGSTPALRLRVDPGPVEYADRLKGALSFDGADLGDMVLLRSDGRPTYNFAVAVDDLEMEISHVIRGIGHLSNTPKQVLLYRALGVEPPEFIHIPSVLAPGGGKLSKRAGAPGVLEYRDRGYSADAIVNYLSLLAWSSEDEQEVFTRQELIDRIDLDRIGASDAEIDPDKLRWMAGQHLRRRSATELATDWVALPEVSELELGQDDLERAAEVFAERMYLTTDAIPELTAVFADPVLGSEEARGVLSSPDAAMALEALAAVWAETEWAPPALKSAVRDAMQACGLPGKAFFQPARIALMGSAHGPDLAAVAYALGDARTADRLRRARETSLNLISEDQ
jgi:nondiscriminating glutamyl-tRNA synthetase